MRVGKAFVVISEQAGRGSQNTARRQAFEWASRSESMSETGHAQSSEAGSQDRLGTAPWDPGPVCARLLPGH